MRHLFGVSFVSFPVQNPKNETRAPTETRRFSAPKTPEIPLKFLVPDRGCEQKQNRQSGGFLVE
jgi:hypothetical protein